MKTIRLTLGAIIFAFAFVSAFAFGTDPGNDNPAIVESGPLGNICVEKDVECGGTKNICELDNITYQEFAESSPTCGRVLRMN